MQPTSFDWPFRQPLRELTWNQPVRSGVFSIRRMARGGEWMEASGSEAAARVRAGSPPRLVAVNDASAGTRAAQPTARLVVFLGVADDASSRVAAALLAHRSKGRVLAVSASTATVELDPVVVGSLAEVGVDLARCQTRLPSPRLLEQAELVVVMGYERDAPATATRTEDWCIDDPRGKDAATVRCIRDAIDRRVQRLLIRLGVAVPAGRTP
jgi:arsenate reductase (thioredoxin)